MANTTKRALAAALKKRLTLTTLDKITIQQLVDDAEVSRKTFYYHFQDVYDLLEWLLIDEGKRVLEGNTTADTWQKGLGNVLEYLQNNRTIILNIFRSVQNDVNYLKVHVTKLILPLMERIFDEQPGHERVAAEDREFILKFYSLGVVELVMTWIESGMKPDAETLMRQINKIFSGSMEITIQRCLEG